MENHASTTALFGQFLLLGFFLLVAKIINKFRTTKLNGARGYLIAAAVLFVLNLLQIFNPDNVYPHDRPRLIGMLVGIFLFPVTAAFFRARAIDRKFKAEALSGGGGEKLEPQ